MRLTTTTNVSVDGVMQGWADLTRIAPAASTAAGGPFHFSIPKPGTISTRSTAARPRFCSAGGHTRSSPAPGER